MYPAVLNYGADGISVEFPDFPGCVSEGDSEPEAVAMARDALALRIFTLERDDEQIPEPASIGRIRVEPNQAVVLIDVWMPPFRDAIRERAVKKTVTVPKWLNDLAEAEHVNFSQVLQRGLKEYLGVSESGAEYAGHRVYETTLRPAREEDTAGNRWVLKREPAAKRKDAPKHK